MKKVAATIALALELSGSSGCDRRRGPGASPGPAAAAAPVEPKGFRYPAGTWRLASFEELDRTTLWVGHVAIRHDQSQVEEFRPLNWRPDSPNPPRTVAEALALAETVWAKVVREPENFDRLARVHSEDVVTKDDGGRLGGVRASQLMGSDFLDVLATLKPGEVSRPFRTPYGFHILKRYAPPPEEQVAGERIVIGYRGVFGLAAGTNRTRQQAQDLAREVAAQARKDVRSFRALVDRYSENADRASHGNMGVYSTRDPEYLPIEIAHLADMKVGETSEPIDSRFGFQILKRVPAVAGLTTYAMAAIELRFDGSPGDQDAARALQKAQTVLRELKAAPDRFQDFQQTYCCDRVQRWTKYRGDSELTAALERLEPGRIAREPLLHGAGYLIVKRLDPRTLPPEAPRLFELPHPTEPDYEAILKNNDGAHIAAAARAFAAVVQGTPALSPEATKTIVDTVDQVASYLEQNGANSSATRGTVLSAMASLNGRLDAVQFSQLKSLGRRWILRQMMPSDSLN